MSYRDQTESDAIIQELLSQILRQLELLNARFEAEFNTDLDYEDIDDDY